MPRISVLIPVYNAQRYLEEALESISHQTTVDFQVLMFDDGSTDASAKICAGMASRDKRFSLLGGEHRGLTYWLNTGIRLATGQFIARMDSDDIAVDYRFERQIRFFEEQPDCVLVGSYAKRIDPEGWPISTWTVACRHEEIDSQHLRGMPGGVIHPASMMRTDAVRRVGGYREEFELAEDYDLFLRLAEVGKIANIPEVLLRYRLHTGSVTISRSTAQHEVASQVLAAAWKRRGRPGPVPERSHQAKEPSLEGLYYWWSRSAFSAKHFGTSIKYAARLLRRRPGSGRLWFLLLSASLGPLATTAKRYLPVRIGDLPDEEATERKEFQI